MLNAYGDNSSNKKSAKLQFSALPNKSSRFSIKTEIFYTSSFCGNKRFLYFRDRTFFAKYPFVKMKALQEKN